MTNNLAALSEAYTKSPNALSLTLLGHALVDEYRAGRLVPVEQRDKAEALLCQRTNEYIEATARAEAAEAENARLRAKLKLIADGLPCELANGKIVNAPIRGQEAQRIAAQALGGEHER